MIADMHSHVLPGMDDGSASAEESIAMLRQTAAQGIGTIVATPHFYARHDTPEAFFTRRERAERCLREEMQKFAGLPEVKLGAEVHFFHGMSESDVLQRLTIGGKRCILIEMPQSPWTDRMYGELADIRSKQGLIPIVAHVDRYIGRFRTFGIPERLEALPVLVQANAEFFLDRFTAPLALRMLRREQIHLLGSDCHNMGKRPPRLGEAVGKIRHSLGQSALDRIESYQHSVV